jgi:hypothetical protein
LQDCWATTVDFLRFPLPLRPGIWFHQEHSTRPEMRMSTPRDERQTDLLRPALDSINDLNHPLVLLTQHIDWTFLKRRLGGVSKPGLGQPPVDAGAADGRPDDPQAHGEPV